MLIVVALALVLGFYIVFFQSTQAAPPQVDTALPHPVSIAA
jgi:hypothetical protein